MPHQIYLGISISFLDRLSITNQVNLNFIIIYFRGGNGNEKLELLLSFSGFV